MVLRRKIYKQRCFGIMGEVMCIRLAFICTHNSCRSQIAEAIGNSLSDGSFKCYSAGSVLSDSVDAGAVYHLKEMYGIDMSAQLPKDLSQLPPIDVVVTMGCGISCPYLPCKKRIAWNIADPSGLSAEEYAEVIRNIDDKVKELLSSGVLEEVSTIRF